MSSQTLAVRQRQQLLQWRSIAHRSQLRRAALLAAERMLEERRQAACLHCWRGWAHGRRQKRTKLDDAAVSFALHRSAAVLEAWVDAAGRQTADRSAAAQTAVERFRARSASAMVSAWALAAREGTAARSAATAQLAAGLERSCLRDCFNGWAARSEAEGRIRAVLDAHTGRRRRRQLRDGFLAWSDIATQDAAARGVLAECFAGNAADRRRAAVLAAWRQAARRSVYLRMAVAEFRHASLNRRPRIRKQKHLQSLPFEVPSRRACTALRLGCDHDQTAQRPETHNLGSRFECLPRNTYRDIIALPRSLPSYRKAVPVQGRSAAGGAGDRFLRVVGLGRQTLLQCRRSGVLPAAAAAAIAVAMSGAATRLRGQQSSVADSQGHCGGHRCALAAAAGSEVNT